MKRNQFLQRMSFSGLAMIVGTTSKAQPKDEPITSQALKAEGWKIVRGHTYHCGDTQIFATNSDLCVDFSKSHTNKGQNIYMLIMGNHDITNRSMMFLSYYHRIRKRTPITMNDLRDIHSQAKRFKDTND